MSQHPHLLPANSTPLERGLAVAMDMGERLRGPLLASRNAKHATTPPDDLLPFLIWEYGLSELLPYFTDLRLLWVEGRLWADKRGRNSSLARALSWIGFAATIEKAPATRRRWHLRQFALSRLAANEGELAAIEGLAALSQKARYHFVRGFRGYDVRALEAGVSRLGHALLDTDSGIRIAPGGALWSFGRTHEAAVTLAQGQMEALGVWLPASGPVGWGDFSWAEAEFAWDADYAQIRAPLIARRLSRFEWHIRLRDAQGATLNHLRAQAVLQGNDIRVSARTPFGMADMVAASADLIVAGTRAGTTAPGALVLAPNALTGGVVLADVATSLPVTLTRTSRDLFDFTVRTA